MHHSSTSGRRPGAARLTATLITTAAALLLALPAPSASAAEYVVHSCQFPDGRAAPVDGWWGRVNGAYGYHDNTCAEGGALQARLETTVTHNSESAAIWQFDAPSNTGIVAVAADRTASVGIGQDYGTPAALLQLPTQEVEHCSIVNGCRNLVGRITMTAPGSEWVRIMAACYGGGTCPAETPKAQIALRRISVTLTDDHAPTTSGVAGSLVQGTLRHGMQEMQFDAADRGSGVKDVAVLVDGVVRKRGVIDTNGGRCDAAEYGHRVPCKLSVHGVVSFDTSPTPDGTRTLQVVVRDAAGNVASAYGPQSVTFDNHPPTMSAPVLKGTAREGNTLTCLPKAVGGQEPTLTYAWRRTRADGSGAETIAGATSATYVLREADVGKKVLCVVTARDQGGSTTRASDPTAGPFADGAVVEPKPAEPTPTTPTQTTPTQTTPTQTTPTQTTPTQTTPTQTTPTQTTPTQTTPTQTTPTQTTPTEPTPTEPAPPPPATQTVTQTVPAQGGGPAAVPVTPTPAPPPGVPGPRRGRLQAVFAATGQAAVLTPYGRTLTVRGKLDDLDGAPIADAPIELVARPESGGADRPVARARTRSDGTFSAPLRVALPSSELVLRYVHPADPGQTLATTTLDLRVRAGLTLTVTKRVRARGLIRFRGRLRGGPFPIRGKIIELRARGAGGKWILFRTIRTDRQGRFRASYRLKRGFRNVTYQFQAVARAEGGYPYAAGSSPVRRTRVR